MEPDFEAFVETHGPRLLAAAHMLTGDPHDASDLVQETLIRMGLRWRRLSDHSSLEAYARVTMVRLNLSRWRKHKRELLTPHVPDVEVFEHRPGSNEWSASLVDAVARLGPRSRTVLVLKYGWDMSNDQIAQHLDCRTSTVRSQVSRSLHQLRCVLSDSPQSYELRATSSQVQGADRDDDFT